MSLMKCVYKYLYKKPRQNNLPIDLSKIVKVLLIREDSIGDLVVTNPFIRGLEKFFPHWEVTVLVSDRNKPLLNSETTLKSIVVPFRHNGFELVLRLLKYRKEEFDLIIDPFEQRISRSCLIYKTLNPKHVIGFAKKEKYGLAAEDFEAIEIQYKLNRSLTFFESFRLFLNQLSNMNLSKHAYMALGRIDIPTEIKDRSLKFLRENPLKKNIFFNIDGSEVGRTLSNEAIKEIAVKLSESAFVIISAAPKKLQTLQDELLFDQVANIKYMYANASMLDVVSVIENIDYVVSVDTAAIHIASLFNKPTIGIYTGDRDGKKIERDLMFDPYSDLSAIVYSHEFLNVLDHVQSKGLAEQIHKEFIAIVEKQTK